MTTLVVAAVALALGGCGRAHTVSVPYVEGLERADALAALTDAGLSAAESSEYSDAVAAGRVIGQDPAGGTDVAAGSTVKLTVSQGPKSSEAPLAISAPTASNIGVSVPNLEGLTKREAQADLSDRGLDATWKSEHSTTVESGLVIRQDPAAGSAVSPGSVVTVVLSEGPEPTAASSQSEETPTSTQSAPQAPREAERQVLYPQADGVNLRGKPQHDSPWVGEATAADTLYYYGENGYGLGSDDVQHEWYYVNVAGTSLWGYVRSDLVFTERSAASSRQVLYPQADGVNLRAEPRHESTWVGEATAGDTLYYYGENGYVLGSDGIEHKWYYVNVAGTDVWGFVRSDLVYN